MFDRLFLYNHFGAGDVFESREFAREWVDIVQPKESYYAHGKHPRILLDMPFLKYTEVTPIMYGMSPYVIDGTDLYVNTWIGRDGSYVLPGIGCVVEEIYRMHNDILKSLGLPQLSKEIAQYIPNIDHLWYNIDGIKSFVAENKQDKVLISNGPVQSCQAENFDFSPIIYKLAGRFPEKQFIITTNIPHDGYDNLIYTGDIIKQPDFDLNEISYLSRFCSTIVGRNSGPHVFSQVYDNWMDETKKIVSFTYTAVASTFVLNREIKARKYWSPSTDTETVFSQIESVLNAV